VVFGSLMVYIFAPSVGGRLKEAVYVIRLRGQIVTVLMRRAREKMILNDNMKPAPLTVIHLRTRQLVWVMNTAI
jgi:hypothetical protein